MQIILHQLKRELSAQRGLLIAWSSLMVIQMLFGLTGLGGAFYGSHASPMTSQILMLLGATSAVGIVLLPAAIALIDPPTDESAHWRALPILPGQLLGAKLLAILVGVALPTILTQTLALVFIGAASWSWHVILDSASNLPAWMLVGFAFGAIAGNWKGFAVGLATLLVGNAMLAFVVNTWTGSHITSNTPVALLLFEKGIENFFSNNMLLLGSAAAVILRYFTRLRGELIVIAFVLGMPATVLIAPVLVGSLVPDYRSPETLDREEFSVAYDLPEQIIVVTNNNITRWHGHVPYSGLKLQGVKSPHFLAPSQLNTTVWAVNDARDSYSMIGQDWFRFPGRDSIAPWLRNPAHFMERHLSLPNAIPDFRIINPPHEAGDGFNLFDIQESTALLNQGTNINLNAQLLARIGTFVPTGILPLTSGSTITSNGTTIRIAAWLPDAGNKTQIKVNTRHIQFATEEDNHSNRRYLDPRRNPADLRYILVNEARGEACLSTTPSNSSTKNSYPLAFQSSVLSFSIADGPTNDLPIASDWLQDANLHVFRALYGPQVMLTNHMNDVEIHHLPRKSPPQKIELKYR